MMHTLLTKFVVCIPRIPGGLCRLVIELVRPSPIREPLLLKTGEEENQIWIAFLQVLMSLTVLIVY